MGLINLLINLVALGFWLNWLSIPLETLLKPSTTSLAGTLRKAEASSSWRWNYFAILIGLLLLRAVFYWEMLPSLHWTPTLQFGIINLAFRSDYFGKMLLFSLLSFAFTLGAFYLWLLLLSVVNRATPDTDVLQKMVRAHFRWLEPWPDFIKLVLPFIAAALVWFALHPLLAWMSVVPEMKSMAQLLKQSALEGVSVYLVWKYLIVGILALHLVHSYVYLGNHPFWLFVNNTARHLLYPIHWLPLRVGKFDFVPVVGIALVFLVAENCARVPVRFPHLLPF